MPAGIAPSRARDNPFRAQRLAAIRYHPCSGSIPHLLQQLERLQFRAAICGPHGTGKTTLLSTLAQHLDASGRRTLRLQLRRETGSTRRLLAEFLRASSTADILLLDGAEQLGRVAWLWFQVRTSRHAGLIITTHAPGRLPTLVECRTDVALLEDIVAELAPEHFAALQPQLQPLFARYSGNLRLCLRALYDHIAFGRTSSHDRKTGFRDPVA